MTRERVDRGVRPLGGVTNWGDETITDGRDAEDLRTSGRGVGLIRRCADAVDWLVGESGTTVRMVFRRSPDRRAETHEEDR